MKSRAKIKENRRLKRERVEKPWLNSEGYHDPTVYAAIRNIERAEKKTRVR